MLEVSEIELAFERGGDLLKQAESSDLYIQLLRFIDVIGLGERLSMGDLFTFLRESGLEGEALKSLLNELIADVGFFVEWDPSVAEFHPDPGSGIDASAAAELLPVVVSMKTSVAAMVGHRVSQELLKNPRFELEDIRVTKIAVELFQKAIKRVTGIEIHPFAQLGGKFVIDHGTGVVIGETTIAVGACRLYHGVTLGGTGSMTTEMGTRHPIIGPRVSMANNSQVLGPAVLEGDNFVGAGAKVITSHLCRGASVGAGVKVQNTIVDEPVTLTSLIEYSNSHAIYEVRKGRTLQQMSFKTMGNSEMQEYLSEQEIALRTKHNLMDEETSEKL